MAKLSRTSLVLRDFSAPFAGDGLVPVPVGAVRTDLPGVGFFGALFAAGFTSWASRAAGAAAAAVAATFGCVADLVTFTGATFGAAEGDLSGSGAATVATVAAVTGAEATVPAFVIGAFLLAMGWSLKTIETVYIVFGLASAAQ